jgi:hypothetical protein
VTLRRVSLVFLSMLSVLTFHARAQQNTSQSLPVRDPEAIQVLSQALKAAGGIPVIATTLDYTAQGNITYYWAGEEVHATATVKGRGTGQYRLDASLSNGIRSWAVSNGGGFIKEPTGAVKQIPYQNAVNFGSLTLPWAQMLRALQDSSTGVSYIGLETANGSAVHHIRLQPSFPANADPRGTFSKLATRDYLIDATYFTVDAIADMVHPDQAYTVNHPHVITFSGYQVVGGILVPFTVSETIAGQHTYTLVLTQISFNSGLQDSDFQQ